MIPLTVGMILGPFIKWGKDDLFILMNRLKYLIIILFFSTIVIWYLNFGGPVLSIVFFILGGSLIMSSLYELFTFLFPKKNQKIKLHKKIFAQISAHLGIGVLIIGVTGSSILKEEKIQFQGIGETIKIKDYQVTFLGVKNVEGENYLSQMGVFDVKKDNKFIKRMTPEKRFYNSGKQMTTEAAINSSIFGDIYIALGDKNENEPQKSNGPQEYGIIHSQFGFGLVYASYL